MVGFVSQLVDKKATIETYLSDIPEELRLNGESLQIVVLTSGLRVFVYRSFSGTC
jgi:hypothetical protein